ncbi:NUDIX domain-containing protein [Halosegnis marinus]|uniref:NUDIX domain-containing protein n=1 Tax=Halosegnis marinus TaxID=3034023 RepID=A0ABD5ZMW4_9EURY|nr:NUDIX domain-containing protein [Halosegnis sp. DT85]
MENTLSEFGYVVNVDCAVVRDGEYLLIRRADGEDHAAGLLGLPGGKLEAPPVESDVLERTARRDLREEVGVAVGDVTLLAGSTFETDAGTPCLNVLAVCEHESGAGEVRAPEEVAAVEWCSASALADREDVPGFTREDVECVEAFRAGNRAEN